MFTNTNVVIITATNAIQTAVEQLVPGSGVLSSAIRQISTLSNEMLFVMFLFGVNRVLKWMPSVYNELIPTISVAAATLGYPCLFGFSIRNFFIGFGIGCIPTGLHQAPKQLLDLKQRIKTGNTEVIKKSDTPTGDG